MIKKVVFLGAMLIVLGTLNAVDVGAQLTKSDYIVLESVKYHPSKIESIYFMKNQDLLAKLGSEIITNELKYSNTPIISTEYYTNVSSVYVYNETVVKEIKENCHDIILNNKTLENKTVCYNDTIYEKVPTKGIRIDWVPYNPKKVIKSKEGLYFKKVLYFKPKLGDISIDFETGMLGHKSTWFNTSWGMRNNITITNIENRNLSGSVQLFNITHNASMRCDFADLRFIDASGEVLDYWFEYNSSCDYVDVWVELGSDNNLSVYYNNSEAKYQGNFENTFELGDEGVSDTTADYTTSGTGALTYASDCGSLANGETVSCLKNTKNSGNYEFYSRSDDETSHKAGNYTLRARVLYNGDINAIRIGMTDSFFTDRQWNIYDSGREALFYHSTTSGRSDDDDEALGLDSGASAYLDEWMIVNSTTVNAGSNDSTNFTLSLASGGDLYNNGYAYADTTTGYLYLYTYSNSAVGAIWVDFWFIDNFYNGTTYQFSLADNYSAPTPPDTQPPLIVITEPTATTYSNETVELNVTANDSVTTWYYELNSNGTNETFSPNISITGIEGSNTIVVWGDDSEGNWGYDSVTFTITFPTEPTNITTNINMDIKLNPYRSECIDDNTLMKVYNSTFTGTQITYETCSNGCYEDVNMYGADCSPMNYEIYFWGILLLLFIVGIITYILRKN